jgi:hypothetical protein
MTFKYLSLPLVYLNRPRKFFLFKSNEKDLYTKLA